MQPYPNNQFGITTTARALHGFTITSEDLSGVVNALACCVRGVYFPPVTVLSPRHRALSSTKHLYSHNGSNVVGLVLLNRGAMSTSWFLNRVVISILCIYPVLFNKSLHVFLIIQFCPFVSFQRPISPVPKNIGTRSAK